MDGVLIDFDKGMTELFGTPDFQSIPKEERWAKVLTVDHFYLNLELMPGAWKLMSWLEHNFGRENMTVLTALARRIPQCASDKILCMNRHFDWPANKVICVYEHKYPWGQFGDYLIDDLPRNIDEWIAAGGRGILFENTHQAMREIDFQIRTGLVR